jgi:hypothetical protein
LSTKSLRCCQQSCLLPQTRDHSIPLNPREHLNILSFPLVEYLGFQSALVPRPPLQAIRFSSNIALFDSPFYKNYYNQPNSKSVTVSGFTGNVPNNLDFSITANSIHKSLDETTKPLSISAIAAVPFLHNAKTEKLAIFSLSYYEINTALGITKTEENKTKKIAPPEYYKFFPLFSEEIGNRLPPHQLYNQKIPLRRIYAPVWIYILLSKE